MNTFRILIIDDNLHHRSMIKSILLPITDDVFEASEKEGSFLISGSIRPDLVITPMRASTPEKPCIYHLLKENPSYRDIPVILTGSSESDENIKKGMAAGAFAYIDKSEAKVTLASIVEKLLKKSSEHPTKTRILVVDDSSSVRLMLQDGLVLEGYEVLTAVNGKKALEVISATSLDLILSDVYMPEMSGLELCKILHENPLFSQIPFVVMSTENDAANMRQMMQYGAAAFIIKPFNIEQLMMTLHKIVSYEFRLLLKEKERLAGEQKLLIAGIASLVKALEARDKYTQGHSERVSLILAGMVKHSGGTPYDIERAQIAGRLHDIGKIGIRDDVLLKIGRLSYDEFEHIQQHPLIGASIITTIPSIADILPVVVSHHERMDGNGYPQGLKGNSIPLWARMTAVADTYDALTSERPYRKSTCHGKALNIINDASGTQLCPSCVSIFLEWLDSEGLDIMSITK